MATYIAGAGGGGKGGGGSARVAKEAPNTLKSKSYAKIVEVLCEGEIEGLAEGMQSIFLENTPLQNADGTFNFEDVVVETREGTLAQPITKIGTTTESTASIGTEIKQATPVTYNITNSDVDKARVAIRVPALSEQNTSNGDLNGSEVKLLVEYNPNGAGWVEPRIGYTTSSVSASGFTGVTSVSGSYSLTSAFTSEYYCTGQNGNNCKTVKKYTSSTATLQYRKDAGTWITFKTYTFIKTQNLQFTLPVLEASTYEIRAVMSSGATASLSFLTGSTPSGELTITGKTTSPYEREVEFPLEGSAPWLIRITRITPDSESAALQNKTFLASITSVFEEKFRYPATAYVAVSINAEQFSSIPSRAYDVKMLKIKIPTNYDPIARTYTGVWDGTFKVEWSDNPAWCFYDLITNKLYGLGERIDAAQVDKWQLYDIAQYCDELVDDGEGVLEPRFTCNVLIQTREEAYKVLQDMASIFAGITYWGSTSDGFQGIIPVQDKPEDTVSYLFTNTNVIDGVFSYQTANASTQYNAVYVTYNDPLDEYKQKVVYVGDDNAIAQDEFVNDTNIVAFGCTSRAQAIRLGRRVLFANKYENDVVSFSTGADGVVPQIGSIINVSDELRAGERRDGRVVEKISDTSVKLDTPFVFVDGVSYKLSFIGFDGVVTEVDVTTANTTTDVVSFTPAFVPELSKNTPYVLTDIGLEAQTFKVVSVSETDQHAYSISAVKHIPSKYGYVDDLVSPTIADTSNITTGEPVTNLQVEEILYENNAAVELKLVVAWTPARYSQRYVVSYSSKLNGNITSVETNYPTVEILNAAETVYNISVVSVDLLGGRSQPLTVDYSVYGKSAPPTNVQDFSVRALGSQGLLQWAQHPDLDVKVGGLIEIRFTPKLVDVKWENGFQVASVSGSQTQTIVPLMRGTYMAKAIDSGGRYSFSAAFSSSEYAEIQQLNAVETISEHPSFSGNKVNLIVQDGVLSLGAFDEIDTVAETIDSWLFIDWIGGVALTGTYTFSNILDLQQIYSVRVGANIDAQAFDLADYLDSRLSDIDGWDSFDGDIVNGYSLKLYISTTNDDPLGTPTWTDWREFLVADYTARAMRFKLEFAVQKDTYNIFVSELGVTADVPDRVDGVENTIIPNTGYRVDFNPPFAVIPAIAISMDNMQQGDYYVISNKSKAGFDIMIYDNTNTAVSRQIDWIAKGYGYVQ